MTASRGSGRRGPTEGAARTNAAQIAGQTVLRTLSALVERADFAHRLGLTHGGKRDLYRIFGYPRKLCFQDFYEQFDRQGVAYAVITRIPETCWGTSPDIVESKDDDTDFELAWQDLVDKLQVFDALERVDTLSRIGKYAVLLLGLDDPAEFKMPVKKASNLRYLTPYSEGNASIKSYDKNPKSPRFNLPETYSIRMRDGADKKAVDVHWTRIIHVAEGALENTLEGHEQLRAIYNNLLSLELVSGASPEMFWRAVARLGLKVQPGSEIKKPDKKKFVEEVEEFVNDFKPWLLLEGIEAQTLTMPVGDPTPHIAAQIDQISAKTGIPKRILMGSEVGDLASTLDGQRFATQIGKRQTKHCEPRVLRSLIDRLIELTVLPTPKDRYTVDWPPVVVRGEKEEAEIGALDSQNLAAYASSLGAEGVVPPAMYRKKMLRFTDEDNEKTEALLSGLYADATADEAAARAAAKEEAAAAAAASGA